MIKTNNRRNVQWTSSRKFIYPHVTKCGRGLARVTKFSQWTVKVNWYRKNFYFLMEDYENQTSTTDEVVEQPITRKRGRGGRGGRKQSKPDDSQCSSNEVVEELSRESTECKAEIAEGTMDQSVEIEHTSTVPDSGEKDEPKDKEKEDSPSPQKAPSAKRKRKGKADVSNSSEGGEQNSNPIAKKSRKDQIVDDFILTQLPALRKEIKLKKKVEKQFNIREYPQYFVQNAKCIPCYLLPLFHFLGRSEIVCSQYGVFNGNKHMVKTTEGFNHVGILTSSCPDISAEEASYLMTRFGREWFKIPAKDQARVASAYRYGDKHEFKVILSGIYEDSFFDDEGFEVFTINPVLRYEAVLKPSISKKKEE
jgi:hypothetical protein